MIRTLFFFLAGSLAMVSYADLMQCDHSAECQLVCYFPSDSARSEQVYPPSGFIVDRVRIEKFGDQNILYTAEQKDNSGPIPTYHALETRILPVDYPCRLSARGSERGFADAGHGGPRAGPVHANGHK